MDGKFSWLEKSDGDGHERFNFQRGPDGFYYAYVPPHGPTGSVPYLDGADTDWTVICLAKRPDRKGIHVVGWYNNATLLPDRRTISEGRVPNDGDTNDKDLFYSIVSRSAYFVPPEFRTKTFSHTSVGQAKYSYLSGPGVKETAAKSEVLKILTRRMEKLRDVAVYNPDESNAIDPEIDEAEPLKGFGTPEIRKKVEMAAERAVVAHFKREGYKETRVAHLNCGYDFEFKNDSESLYVEVKGTASEIPRFLMTRNEYSVIEHPGWRLALVTEALSQSPKVMVFDCEDLKKRFVLEPYVYIAGLADDSEDA